MHQERKIAENIYWIGGSDRRLAKFENCFPIPNGISYNSYLVTDEKTVLLDTVDRSVSTVFFENLAFLLKDRKLDYVIVNHMEPDHAATLAELLRLHPETTVVGNAKTFQIIRQFFDLSLPGRIMEVKEGDQLCSGQHTFSFVMAAMVHWPEVMVTYEQSEKILFSADAFGTFGAFSGNIFAEEVNFETEWLDEARRYYTNIVGKYGIQVQTLLNKAAGLEIEMLCPLHGPVWRIRKKIEWYIGKYSEWATYRPEDRETVIFCGSVYGDTEDAASLLAGMLAERKIRHIRMYDVSVTDVSYLVSEAFRASHLVFASPTYNGDIFPPMENLLRDLKAHNMQNRTVALIENGTWAPSAGKKMNELLATMKNMTVLPESITMKSALKESQYADMSRLADAIEKSLDLFGV